MSASALYRAVCAAPDDDLPRLVYADWMEENGHPYRAEFIRVQCRLADASPADADYVDLLEREAELKAYLWRELDADRPPLPPGMGLELEYRGFVERLRFGYHEEFRDRLVQVDRLRDTMPVRGLRFERIDRSDLRRLATSPVGRVLHSLDLPELTTAWRMNQTLGDVLASGDGELRLRRVCVGGREDTDSFAGFATSPGVRALNALHAPQLYVERFTPIPFADSLRELRLYVGLGWFLVGRERGLQHLHSLGVSVLPTDDARDFADADRLPRLAHVELLSGHDGSGVAAVVRRDTPLASFTLGTGGQTAPALVALAARPWLRQLRVLRTGGESGELVRSPRLTGLRQLHLSSTPRHRVGVEQLERAGFWPTLTTLALPFSDPTPSEAVRLLSRLVAPRLKHLNLKGVPLGDAGAVAIARNPTFAGLTRLNLSACRIGPVGMKALFDSPHLQRLIELDLYANGGGEVMRLLADEGLMPALGLAEVAANGLTDDDRRWLKRRAAIRVG